MPPLPFSSPSLPGEVVVAAAGVDDEEEDGEDAEGHDGAEEDDAAGVRAVGVLSVAVGGAVGGEDECVCGAHGWVLRARSDSGFLVVVEILV